MLKGIKSEIGKLGGQYVLVRVKGKAGKVWGHLGPTRDIKIPVRNTGGIYVLFMGNTVHT